MARNKKVKLGAWGVLVAVYGVVFCLGGSRERDRERCGLDGAPGLTMNVIDAWDWLGKLRWAVTNYRGTHCKFTV